MLDVETSSTRPFPVCGIGNPRAPQLWVAAQCLASIASTKVAEERFCIPTYPESAIAANALPEENLALQVNYHPSSKVQYVARGAGVLSLLDDDIPGVALSTGVPDLHNVSGALER